MALTSNTQYGLTDLQVDTKTSTQAPTTVSTTPYTLLSTDSFISASASSITVSTLTINLTTAVGNAGRYIKIKKTDATQRTVTIDANGSETIDGQLTYILSDLNQSVLLTSDGANWLIA